MGSQKAGANAVIGSEAKSGTLTSFQGRTAPAAVLTLADVTGTGLDAAEVGAAGPILNLAQYLTPGGLVDNAAALNALIQASPSGSTYYGTGTFGFLSAIEVTKLCAFVGAAGRLDLIFQCMSGFTDTQLIRNWASTDWQATRTASVGVVNGTNVVTDAACSAADANKIITPGSGFPPGSVVGVITAGVSYTVLLGIGGAAANFLGATGTITLTVGESNHYYAPVLTAANERYSRYIDLGLDANSQSNLTLLSRVHPQEGSMVDRVTYLNTGSGGTGITGRADFCNNDSGGASTGVAIVRNEVQYQSSWARMIDFDGTLGNKLLAGSSRVVGSDLQYDGITTGGGLADGTVYSDSPIRVNSATSLHIRTCHSQAFPNNGVGADTQTFSDGVTNSTTTVSSVLFAETLLAGNVVGRLISDASGDIPAGAYITAYNPASPTQVTISAAATGSHSANTLTIGSDKACFRLLDVARATIDDITLTASGGGPLIRPALRSTFSGTINASDPVAPMLVTGFKLVPSGSGAFAWSTGSPIIEDAGGASFQRYLKATTFDPRVIYYYDGTNYIWANGSTAAISKAGFTSTPDAQAFNDMLGWSADWALASTGTALPGAASVVLCKVPLPQAISITNVLYHLTTVAGSTLTHCFMAVFKSDGTFVGQTADQTTIWETGGTTGLKSPALAGGPFPVAPLAPNDFVWVAFYVGTAAGTLPSFMKVNTGNGADYSWHLAVARTRFGSIAQADTATLASITPSGIAVAATGYLVGIN